MRQMRLAKPDDLDREKVVDPFLAEFDVNSLDQKMSY